MPAAIEVDSLDGGAVAITGHTGFVGTKLLEKISLYAPVVKVPLRDLQTATDLAEFLSSNKCRCLVHLAGPLPTGNPAEQDAIEDTTVHLATLCAEAVQALPSCSLVLTSTVRMYGLDAGAFCFSIEPAPFDGYGRGKLRAEEIVKTIASEAHPVTVLRVSSVCGFLTQPDGSKQPKGLAHILTHFATAKNKITVMGDGSSTKDLLHVDDLVEAICVALNQPPGQKQAWWRNVFIGSGQPITVLEVAQAVAKKVEQLRGEGSAPVEIAHGTASPNDLAGAVDPEPAERELGWRASIDVHAQIAEAAEHMVLKTSTEQVQLRGT